MKQKSNPTLRSSDDLLQADLIKPDQLQTIKETEQQFSIAITPQVQDTIRHVGDAIYQQYVPHSDELSVSDYEYDDPIGDEQHRKVKGIIHRYPDRCLLLAVNVCATYCRFCFRREKIGAGNAALTPAELETAIQYISTQPDIWEVILSGGDPLIMKPKSLNMIMQKLTKIDHVQVVRLHTRIPAVDPQRINADMIQALKMKDKAVYVVLHVNHPQEFTPTVEQACARLIDVGIPMLSQSVLLRGINDDEQILAKLMRKFVSLRIKPYYLHHCDLAKGTGHFRTSIHHGQQLMRKLRGRYSGLCQPTYMLDIPGGFGKVPIGPQYINITESSGEKNEAYTISDYKGHQHHFQNKKTER